MQKPSTRHSLYSYHGLALNGITEKELFLAPKTNILGK